MKKLRYILIFIPVQSLIIFCSISCSHDLELVAELDTVCFDTQIFPIISSSCGISGCHSGINDNPEFNASNYESIVKDVKAGDPRNSLLYNSLTRVYGNKRMPPDEPLPIKQRTLIQIWIEQGALNTKCLNNTNTTNNNNDSVCFKQDVQPLLISNCATTNCHDNISQVDEFVFTTYESTTSNDDAVRPFLPGESKIYLVLNETGDDRMPPPPLPALSESEKEIIRKWIADGALNSDCPSMICDTLELISFAGQIWPVVSKSCVGCHNSTNSKGGITLDNYSEIITVASEKRNGISLLTGVIRKEAGFSAMPPSGELDDCSIRLIELWIEQGMINN